MMTVTQDASKEAGLSLGNISSPYGAFKMILFLWFIFLFEPARLVSHYVPFLRPLKWIPEILLYASAARWLMLPIKKYGYPWFTTFMLLTLLGTVIAFFEGNWGIARLINRQLLQYYVLGLMTLSLVDDEKKMNKLFSLYFLYFLYYALWGIYSLKVAPIGQFSDPSLRTIIAWHHQFDNRDGFGTLMGVGLAYCVYFFSFAENKSMKYLSLTAVALCMAGVVMSFARAVFLGVLTTLIFVWAQSKRKFTYAMVILIILGIMVSSVSLLAPGDKYWKTMGTIFTEGAEGGTGADRLTLWSWAFRVFLDNPIFGAGTGNVGIRFVDLIPEDEALRSGYTQGRLWGRALHCAPMTIMSEHGIVGIVVFFFLNMDFIIVNHRNRSILLRNSKEAVGGQMIFDHFKVLRKRYLYFVYGLMACFVAYWVNSIFYEVLYCGFFWNLIVLNRLIYINVSNKQVLVCS